MAIKGKSKPRAKRTVTSGPKPAYVVPKKPILLRRRFQIGALAVIVLASAAGITYGLHREHQRQAAAALKAAEQKYVGQFKAQVTAALGGVGQPSQTSGFDVLPTLSTSIIGLQAGSTSPKDAANSATTSAQSAKQAYTSLTAIKTTQIIGGHGFDVILTTDAINAQSGMVNGLKIYEQAANALGGAAHASGQARKQLLTVATGLLPTAKAIFGKAYLDFLDAQNTAGIFTPPTQFGQPGAGLPPGFGAPPGGLPPGAGVPPGGLPPGAGVPPGGLPPGAGVPPVGVPPAAGAPPAGGGSGSGGGSGGSGSGG